MKGQSWKQLVGVQAGGAICLPIFVIGNLLAEEVGFYSAVAAIVCGNAILLLLGSISAYASARDRKSTAEYAAALFGPFGKGFFSLAMAAAMMGWFGIQLTIMSESLLSFLPDSVPLLWINIGLGAAITLVALFGIGALNALASLSMPVLIGTIGFALYQASGEPARPYEASVGAGGVSLVLAAAIGAVVDLPTFFREARSKRDSVIASILLFALVLPLLEGVGVYLNLHSEGKSLLEVLTLSGSASLWGVWVAAFLLLAGWTTNNANLYSASVSLATALPGVGGLSRVLLLGGMGTAVSLLPMQENMSAVLEGIGVLLSSMGALLTLHFFSGRKAPPYANFAAWALGLFAGVWGISGMAVLDAYAAALFGGIMLKLLPNKEGEYARSYRFGS